VEQNDDTSFVDEDVVLSLSTSQGEAGATRDSVVCKYSWPYLSAATLSL
jgi:hypothetical protein